MRSLSPNGSLPELKTVIDEFGLSENNHFLINILVFLIFENRQMKKTKLQIKLQEYLTFSYFIY